MGQLRVQQANGVAPGAESARPILHARFPRDLGHFVLWNQIANLAQNVKPTTCWLDDFLFFTPAVWQAQNVQANTFSFSVGWLWKERNRQVSTETESRQHGSKIGRSACRQLPS